MRSFVSVDAWLIWDDGYALKLVSSLLLHSISPSFYRLSLRYAEPLIVSFIRRLLASIQVAFSAAVFSVAKSLCRLATYPSDLH